MQQVADAAAVLWKLQQPQSVHVPLSRLLGGCIWYLPGAPKLSTRLGLNTTAAAAGFLQRWPEVFNMQHDPAAAAAHGTSGVTVQLQRQAVQWLLGTRHFKRQLASYKAALLARIRAAAAAATPDQGRGIEAGLVGNKQLMQAVMAYRQVRECVPWWLCECKKKECAASCSVCVDLASSCIH
jgi:hypothetical protein